MKIKIILNNYSTEKKKKHEFLKKDMKDRWGKQEKLATSWI